MISINGTIIDKEKFGEIYLLISLLKNSTEGIEKQTICESLWNYSYNPTIHDSRIYKLINKARNLIGISDIIENLRGKYRLNIKYL